MVKRIKQGFEELFINEPLMVSAPGRINIIGEHTDYNDGFVLPASINKYIHFAVAKNGINNNRFVAYNLNDNLELSTDNLGPNSKQWSNYLLGVISQIRKMGRKISGIDCVFGGNIPIGAGISSSAAIETGFAFALNELFDLNLSKHEIAMLSQKAEHEHVGVKCGIMDQFASVFGEKDKVIQLDCRTLEHKLIPFDLKDYSIVLCDTNVKHSLAGSEYNTRRLQCEEGVSILKKYDSTVTKLRDVSIEMLLKHRDKIPPVIFKRCKYVVEENNRLLEACEALSNGNISRLGELIYETHSGLKDEYEVSCYELDVLVDIARESGLVAGARMMGGGFGGCTINLVQSKKLNDFIDLIKAQYRKRTNTELKHYYEVSIVNGTSIINNPELISLNV